jgi:hypothetical protein
MDPRRHLPLTPLDLLRAKAVDQNLRPSSTDRTRTTATVLCPLAMLETYKHPIILWRRADHKPLQETGLFLPSRMLQKVSVLCPVSSHIPSRTLSLFKRVRLHQLVSSWIYSHRLPSAYILLPRCHKTAWCRAHRIWCCRSQQGCTQCLSAGRNLQSVLHCEYPISTVQT